MRQINWSAVAAILQAVGTLALVGVTWVYVRLIARQARDTTRLAHATEQSVELLLKRERQETLEALRILHQAADKLWHDADNWLGQNVVNLVHNHSFPENGSFDLANADEVIAAVAKLGGQIAKLMTETLRWADDVRGQMAQLRSLQRAVDERSARKHATSFPASCESLKNTANKVMTLAFDAIGEIEAGVPAA